MSDDNCICPKFILLSLCFVRHFRREPNFIRSDVLMLRVFWHVKLCRWVYSFWTHSVRHIFKAQWLYALNHCQLEQHISALRPQWIPTAHSVEVHCVTCAAGNESLLTVYITFVPCHKLSVANLSNARLVLDPRSVHVRLVVVRVALGAESSPNTAIFPCRYNSKNAPILIYHLHDILPHCVSFQNVQFHQVAAMFAPCCRMGCRYRKAFETVAIHRYSVRTVDT